MKTNYLNFVILLVVLCVTQLMSYIPLRNISWNIIIFILEIILIVKIIKFRNTQNVVFEKPIKSILLFSFGSIIVSQFVFSQQVLDSIKSTSLIFVGYFLYFVLVYYRIRSSYIIKIILCYAVIYSIVELIQQITFPTIWFSASRALDGIVNFENRFGITRFTIRGIDFLLLAYCISLYNLLSNKGKKLIWLFVTVIIISGIYMYGARKLLYIILLSSTILVWYSNRKYRYTALIVFLFIIVVLYNNYYTDFINENAILNSKQEANSGDFIRYTSAIYFLTQFSDSILYFLFGAGVPWASSPLGKEIHNLADWGYYQADSGIIGYYSMFGIMGVFSIFYLYYIFIKNIKYIDIQYKVYFLAKLCLIFFDFWAIIQEGVLVMCLFLFLVTENINSNRKKILCRT